MNSIPGADPEFSLGRGSRSWGAVFAGGRGALYTQRAPLWAKRRFLCQKGASSGGRGGLSAEKGAVAGKKGAFWYQKDAFAGGRGALYLQMHRRALSRVKRELFCARNRLCLR